MNVLGWSIIVLCLIVGVIIWEFHYLIDIAHAPNWAVFTFVILSLGIGSASARR